MKSRLPEDPHVRQVEELLNAVAVPSPALTGRGKPPRVSNALWFCGCYSEDDAPVWLIHDLSDGRIAWCRVSDVEPLELVDARSYNGGHGDPAGMLAWLMGAEPDPWAGGDGGGDASVIDELGTHLRARHDR